MAVYTWSSSVNHAISVNAMLSVVSGLSSVSSVPETSSIQSLNYIGKDIIGQIGGMIYAMRTGKKADHSKKNYAITGVKFSQAGCYMENFSKHLIDYAGIVNPLFPLLFLGSANFLKNISWITIGAANAAKIASMSKEHTGQIYSEIAAINTFASTLGMACGIGIIHLVPSFTVRSLCIMPVMTGISMYSMKKAMETTT